MPTGRAAERASDANGSSDDGAPRVAVVGAGLGGLAAAVRLAAGGCEVELFEKGTGPGGKAGSLELSGYRFDTGPSLFTLPQVFEELLATAGRRLEDYLELVPLDPVFRHEFSDGTVFRAPAGPARFAGEAERVFGVERARVEAYLRYCERLYRIAAPVFLNNSLHELETFLQPRVMFSILRSLQIDPFRSMARANQAKLGDPRLVQLFNRLASYNGSNPYRAPATFNLIGAVEQVFGAYGVRGGIYAVPRMLAELAGELGVTLRYGAPVERILRDSSGHRDGNLGERAAGRRAAGGRVCGVRVGGEERRFDAVVTNIDPERTYRELLEDTEAPWYRRYLESEPSSSAIVFLWGLDREFPELGLHNMFYSAEYRDEFSRIFDAAEVSVDPTVYLNIGCRVTPEDAPTGGENWFVLINAPPDRGQDWADLSRRVRKAVLGKLARVLGCDLETHLRVEQVLTPAELAERTGSFRGSLYGLASNRVGAAFSRHPNRSRRYPGLYFCGGAAHPGGGMPLAVRSGALAAELLLRRARSSRTAPVS